MERDSAGNAESLFLNMVMNLKDGYIDVSENHDNMKMNSVKFHI